MRLLRQHIGAPESVVIKMASDMVRAFQQRFGGAELYVPKPLRYDEAEVLRAFNGRNVDEVTARFQIHPSTLYRIVRRAKNRGEAVPDFPAPQSKPAAAPARSTPRKPPEFSW